MTRSRCILLYPRLFSPPILNTNAFHHLNKRDVAQVSADAKLVQNFHSYCGHVPVSVSSGHGSQLSSIREHHTPINERPRSTRHVHYQTCDIFNRTRPLRRLIRTGEDSFLSDALALIDNVFFEQRLGEFGREH